VGAITQVVGVTFFSIVMNAFIGVVMSMNDSEGPNNEDLLAKWL